LKNHPPRRASKTAPAATQAAPVAFDRGALYQTPLFFSTLRALERDLLGGVSRALAQHLEAIRSELNEGTLAEAIRLIDRAWRALPESAEVLAPIYARLMSLEDRDDDAALRLLQVIDVHDSDIPALLTRAYLRLRRPDDAKRTLDRALKQFSVAPDGLLAGMASQAIMMAEMNVPGWIGRGPTLDFIGELSEAASLGSLQLSFGKEPFAHSLKSENRNGRTLFSFQAPPQLADGLLHASVRGIPLLGSAHRLPTEFSLDGRTETEGDWILGWARLGWLPRQPLRLKFEDEIGNSHELTMQGAARPGFKWPFRLNVRSAGLRGGRIDIKALLPDGRWQPLPDAPLLLARAVRFPDSKPSRLPRWRKDASAAPRRAAVLASPPGPEPPVDVVIPVYKGLQETLSCIDSVLATVGSSARVIVIDDATEEAALAAALDELAAAGSITLMRNERNLGFVGTVNRALAIDSPNDIVLLNSDTQVFNAWLPRLRAAAYGTPRVGTVTPLSNDGSIASYPRPLGASMHPETAASLDELASATHPGISIEVPVGVGFCLYIRRDCLKEVGELDASVFGKGYGEEVDFCMRARQKNWSHRVAADVFVYHASGSSFGARRAALLDRSQRLLNLRYPGYDRYIADFLAVAPLAPLRRSLDEQRLAAFDGRFVLLLTLALEGGVARFVAERGHEVRAQGLIPLLLKPRKAGDSTSCELATEALDVPNLHYDIPEDLAALGALLRRLPIERIEIQHFLDIDAKVIETVRALGVPYDIIAHDYAWICPRVTLIDGRGRYCNEPAVSECKVCVRKNGSRLGDSISVPALRARSAVWMSEARQVSAPSTDTAARLRKYFPNLDIEVRPHKVPQLPAPSVAASPRSDRLRVGLLGAIGGHKGYQVLLDCARDAARRGLPLEFVVIGYTENDKPLLKTGNVFVTGRYSEVEVPHLLRRERPDVVFLPSVWPETWCYALDYAMEAGLPVISFDIGAIAERLRAAQIGILLSLDLEPGDINDRLVGLIGEQGNPRTYVQRPEPVRADAARIKGYMETNQMNPSPVESSRDEALSASVQVLPLPAGLYLFSVKAASGSSERGSGKLALPAMHVGMGPGTRSEHVEFISGPGTDGAWLFASGDVLVAKVSGPGATLILTSVRASNGDVLSIAVERLESRSLAAPAAPAEENTHAPIEAPIAAVAPALHAEEPAEPSPNPTGSFAADSPTVPLQIKTHIRTRGDMTFTDAPWAGRVAPGLWIESFSIQPLKHMSALDVEYKGLTGTGFETPWLSEDQNCGTKGISVPLVGFAMRLKPGAATAAYECEYSGYYRSGVTVGPLRNGAPCRSMVANDPLEGIQIRIVKRSKSATVAVKAAGKAESQRAGVIAPSFGRYRDMEVVSGNGTSSQSVADAAVQKAVKRIKPVETNGSSDRRPRSTQRTQNRNS
jgi:GT2 family glycosyltransferase